MRTSGCPCGGWLLRVRPRSTRAKVTASSMACRGDWGQCLEVKGQVVLDRHRGASTSSPRRRDSSCRCAGRMWGLSLIDAGDEAFGASRVYSVRTTAWAPPRAQRRCRKGAWADGRLIQEDVGEHRAFYSLIWCLYHSIVGLFQRISDELHEMIALKLTIRGIHCPRSRNWPSLLIELDAALDRLVDTPK